MMFVIVAFFMAIYLVDDVHSASISNGKLTVSISMEEVWDSLSEGEKHALMIIFVAKLTLIS